MINRKISRILGPTLGIMGFVLAIGVMESPVFADSTGIIQASEKTSTVTTQAGAAYTAAEKKDYFININKSETQNGVKVTVDKVMAGKHNLKVVLKVESDKAFDKKTEHENSIFELTYGNNYEGHTESYSKKYLDDKTMIVTLEKDYQDGEYPEKGDMRVDVVFSNFKVNIGIDVPVDFTESFKNVIEKDISGKVPEFDYTLNKVESDIMGTTITYTEPKKDDYNYDKENSICNSIMVLKFGDKMYKLDSNGSYMGKDKEIMGNYKSESATYDKVKSEKNISILPIISHITNDDFYEMNKEYDNETATTKDIASNVSYENNFKFADGSKGTIYKIERNDNSIKLYCKGESEKESLLMATNIFASYKYEKEEKNHVYYDSSSNVSFYKDPNEAFGYVVELDNVDKDKEVNVEFDQMIKQADKYSLEDEIKISN